MKKKILFVVTSHNKKGDTQMPTGYYLSEVTHPWEVLHNAGFEIDFVSPKGGLPPVFMCNLDDPTNRTFWEHPHYRNKIETSLKPSEVTAKDYKAIYFAGGHGAVWDFTDNIALAEITKTIYENGGVVSAICHGLAGLVNVKLNNNEYLIAGKKVNAFTNEEEISLDLHNVVPYSIEDKLTERGAIFENSPPWQPHLTVDGNIISGQNPASAKGVGEAILAKLS